MTKRRKKLLISSGVLVLLLISGYFIAQRIIVSKIEGFLKTSLPSAVSVEYKDLDVNLLIGSLKVDLASITYTGETTGKLNALVELEKMEVNGVKYLDYLFSGNVHIGEILLKQPQITYNHDKNIPSEEYRSSKVLQLNNSIRVENILVTEGKLKIIDRATDSLIMKTDDFNFDINDIQLNNETIKTKIPVLFENYQLSFGNLFFKVGDYENIEISQVEINTGKSILRDLKLYTKYNKQELSRIIPVERDHFNLNCPLIELNSLDLGFVQDSMFYFKCPKITFNEPDLKVFRDKLVHDDLKAKKLYGTLLRNLPFHLNVDSLQINKGSIRYTEKVKAENNGGTVHFSNFNLSVQNLSNTYVSPVKTTIQVTSEFMGTAPLQANWSFDVNDRSDAFMFHANIGKLPANNMNQFIEPNLGKRVEGDLLNTVFTIHGNPYTSSVDMGIKYRDFDVIALRKDGKRKNKVLSNAINVFVDNDSGSNSNSLREVQVKEVERDQTKSVFNFIWKNVKAGLLKAMVKE